jgi:hypothetical protein
MDGNAIGMNAVFVLNYTLPGMTFKPGPGSPSAGRRPLRPRRGTSVGSTGFYTGRKGACPVLKEGKHLWDRDTGIKASSRGVYTPRIAAKCLRWGRQHASAPHMAASYQGLNARTDGGIVKRKKSVHPDNLPSIQRDGGLLPPLREEACLKWGYTRVK